MNRREILKYTAYLTGAAVATPLAGSLFSSCRPTTGSGPREGLYFFTSDEFGHLKEWIDTILPKTDSPSATDVGVHNIIDSMVGTVYTEKDRLFYRKGFDSLLNHLTNTPDLKESFLQIEKGQNQKREIKNIYLHIKQQTIAYYLSTEEIGKHYLNYQPVPGEYISCIPLEEAGGKAWAL
jgi:hypothetical protein